MSPDSHSQNFSHVLSLPMATPELRNVMKAMVEMRLSLAGSPRCRLADIQPDDIMAEAVRIAGTSDTNQLREEVAQLLRMLVVVGTDAQRLAEWAIEADLALQSVPKKIQALSAPGVKVDSIKPVAGDGTDT